MKRYFILVCGLILLLSTQLLFWGYSPDNATEIVATRYLFLAPLGDKPNSNQTIFRDLLAEGICQGDNEYGTNTEFIACSDNASMAEAIQKGIYSNVDGIIISGFSEASDTLIEAVAKARSYGIPIVLVDHKISGLEYDCYIGSDNQNAGSVAAQILAKQILSNTQAVIIVSDMEGENLLERIESFSNTWNRLTGLTNIKIVKTNGEYPELRRQMLKLFDSDRNYRAIFCADAVSTVGMKDLIKSIKQDISIVGFDTLPDILTGIEEGIYIAVIGQDTQNIGHKAIQYLVENPEIHENIEAPELQVSIFTVDQTNINAYKNDTNSEVTQEWLIN